MRALIRSLSQHQGDRLASLFDQAFQGGANIVAAALLARALPPIEFGKIGVLIGIYYIVSGFHRSAIVLPYLTERHPGLAHDRRYHSDWWWLSLMAIAVIAALLAAATLVAGIVGTIKPSWRWIYDPLFLAIATTPPLLVNEHTRRWLYQTHRAGRVAIASACYAAAMIATSAIAPHVLPNAASGAAAWIAAGTAGAVASLVVLRPLSPHWSASIAAFARNRSFAQWQSLTNLPYAVYNGATVVVLIGALFGPAGAAIFTAARTLTNPAASIVSAVDSTDKPRAARAMRDHGLAALRRSVGRTRLLLVVLTGLYLAAVALFAQPLLALLFHGRYADIEGVVRLLAIAFFLTGLNQPSETLLIVLRDSRGLFVARILTAVATVLALALAKPWGGIGMAVALIIGQGLNLVFLAVAGRHATAHAAREGTPALGPA